MRFAYMYYIYMFLDCALADQHMDLLGGEYSSPHSSNKANEPGYNLEGKLSNTSTV